MAAQACPNPATVGSVLQPEQEGRVIVEVPAGTGPTALLKILPYATIFPAEFKA